MLCASGENNASIMKALANGQSAISKYHNNMCALINDAWLEDENFDNLPPQFATRTNKILYKALKNLDIQSTIEKYGAENIAVIMGNTTAGVEENFQKLKNGDEFLKEQDQRNLFISVNSISNPAIFVRELYSLKSLAYSVSTACTSGLKAIIEGMYLIKNGFCKAVICGGCDGINSLTIAGFSNLDILSDERANPFSKNRKGTNLGEGACVFILSQDKMPECVEILASGSNNDAFHITKPSQDCSLQKQLASHVLKESKLKKIDYVNLHGTATISNDTMEATLMSAYFTNTPCSSTKASMGHTLGACGALEIGICAQLILDSTNNKACALPVNIYDGECEFKDLNLVKKGDKAVVNSALSSSFAFGGDNAMMILGRAL